MNDNPTRACADCEKEHGILDRSDWSKSHGQCRRHWIKTLVDGGYSTQEVTIAAQEAPPEAFCQDLGTAVRESADWLVARLLEDETLIRVCSSCEKKFGQLQVPSGHQKSHGYCQRHSLAFVDDALAAGGVPSDKAEAMKRRILSKDVSQFAPDMAHQTL